MQTVADLQLFHVLKYTITGNKYKFAQIVQETATNVHKFGQLLYKIITQYSRQCLMHIYFIYTSKDIQWSCSYMLWVRFKLVQYTTYI